jgi:hypothetical protein
MVIAAEQQRCPFDLVVAPEDLQVEQRPGGEDEHDAERRNRQPGQRVGADQEQQRDRRARRRC